ncbi:MAG: antibiotic biosynthesis monooxygenase family protein [Bryobacteraceae bacterium]
MNRRKYIRTLAAAGAAAAVPAQGVDPIQLHVDLDVAPTQQKDFSGTYHKVFRPAISRQPGFVDVKLMKLRSALAGSPPANSNYRLIISFQTEEQRKAWVATDLHQKVWPQMEKHLKSKYSAILYDLI